MKKQIEELTEVLGCLIIMLTFNSQGKLVPRDSCDKMLKRIKGKKWSKEYERAIRANIGD